MNNKTETHSEYREQIGGCQMGGGLGRWVKKVKGVKKYKLPVVKIALDGVAQWIGHGPVNQRVTGLIPS